MSTSPTPGQVPPLRRPAPSIQNAGQYPSPPVGCWIEDCIITTPPAGAPKSERCVSMRPDVQPLVGFEPLWSARMTRCPAPSWNTFAVLLVIVSISPVPKIPVPVSYLQFAPLTPVPPAPVKSSLHV